MLRSFRSFRCTTLIRSQRRLFANLGKGFDILGSDDDTDLKCSIRGFGDHSFQINNVVVEQSVLVFPNSFLLWNANKIEDITVENLKLFSLLHPTLDLLVIGCGEKIPRRLDNSVHEYFKSKGIMIEVQDSIHACSTFNVLNSEGRNVAAALLTLKPREENA